MIPRSVIEAIKDRTDIVDLIGTYVTLRRAGSNHVGLCPFHSERTPSFTVFEDNQSFHCFGCGAGGDVFTFIMRLENLEYPEAVEVLAKRAGIEIPTEDGERQKPTVSRRRVHEMNLIAARFWRDCLNDPEMGRAGRAYLYETRHMSTAIVRRFGIGYAPNDFQALTHVLQKAGYTAEEMKAAFLCGISQKTGRPFDLFRDRVIFPVMDNTGNVLAFSGRRIDGLKEQKYVNSSDTPVFQKRKNLFALNFARNHGAERMILCEGNIDVVALHDAGFENAVASLGTALTDEQARVLSKYTKQILLAYDSDEAGQKATNRALEIFAKVGLDVRIVRMNGAKDPDEYIQKFGKDAFARLLGQGSTGFEYKLTSTLSKHDITLPEEKIRAAAELCGIIARVYSSAEREVYIAAAARRLELSPDSLHMDVERIRRKNAKEYRERESRRAMESAMAWGDKINPEAAGNVHAAVTEDTIIGLLLLYPEHRTAVKTGRVALTSDDFVTAFNRRAFEAIMALENSDDGYDFSMLGQTFSADEMGRLVKLEQSRRQLSENGTAVLRSAVDTLKGEGRRRAAKQAENAVDGIEMILAGKRKRKSQDTEPPGDPTT